VILDFFHQQPHEIKKILNLRDASDGTGLMIASYYNHYDLVETLIKQGVDIDVKDYVRYYSVFTDFLLLSRSLFSFGLGCFSQKMKTAFDWASTSDIKALLLVRSTVIPCSASPLMLLFSSVSLPLTFSFFFLILET
jgi:ankyrin repeat protein